MAFVGAGMGIPTVSRHRQGRNDRPTQGDSRDLFCCRGTDIRSESRARLSSGAVALGSFLRRPAAWKLASELASLVTAPERTETAGAFQHVVNSFHSSSAAAQTERSVRADAGSRLHRETHVALFAQARLALDPFPINLSCHGRDRKSVG